MIAHAHDLSPVADPQEATFLELLPKIVASLRYEFRKLGADRQEEAIQEGVAGAFVAFQRLMEQGRASLIYPTPLARYAARQVRAGRQVGGKLNSADVSSKYAQQRKGIKLLRLDRYNAQHHEWREAVVDDPRTPVLEQVWFRIDFPAWLKQLPRRMRRIALTLARGEAPSAVAVRFDLSRTRITQIRHELEASWRSFQAGR